MANHQANFARVQSMQADIATNIQNSFSRTAANPFIFNPVVIPPVQKPGNVFDFHNIFINNSPGIKRIPDIGKIDIQDIFNKHGLVNNGLPKSGTGLITNTHVPKHGIDYNSIFKLHGINVINPKVPVINPTIPSVNSFNFATIFMKHPVITTVSLKPDDINTVPNIKATIPQVIKVYVNPTTVPTVSATTTPVEPDPGSPEELEDFGDMPDIDTSVDVFEPVVVAPRRHFTTGLPKRRPNYNPDTGERIDTSVDIFKPVTKNAVPMATYNDKIKLSPEVQEFLNEI